MCDYLYKAGSIREVGTMKYFRERLNRKNVTPEKVTRSFEGTEDFFVSIGKAYILEAAMEFFGMNDLDDSPTKHQPPPGILHHPNARKKAYFDDAIGAFVDTFVMADPDCDSVEQNRNLQQRSSQVADINHDHDYLAADNEDVEQSNDENVVDVDLSKTDKVRCVNYLNLF